MNDVDEVNGHLYVSEAFDPDRDYGRLIELDPATGDVLSTRFQWPDPFDIVVDPRTRGLLLLTCPSGKDCFAKSGQDGGNNSDARIVLKDPATGRQTDLVANTNSGLIDGFGVAVSNDGDQLFASHKVSGISVFSRRTGGHLRTLPTGAFVDFMGFGPPRGCFADQLVYQLDDGSIWTVRPSDAVPISRLVASSGQGLALEQGRIRFDLKGRLVVVSARNFGEGWVTIIDCKAIPPPQNPPPPATHQQPASHPDHPRTTHQPPADHAPPPAGGHSVGGAPGPAAPPGSAQTAPATQPVTQPAHAPTFGQAPHPAAGTQPGLADAIEDTPQLGFSASRRRPAPAAPVPVWVPALLLTAAAAFTCRRNSFDKPISTRKATL